jgi:hypothetical protein
MSNMSINDYLTKKSIPNSVDVVMKKRKKKKYVIENARWRVNRIRDELWKGPMRWQSVAK